MNYKSNIRLVYSHSKGVCGADDLCFVIDPVLLDLLTFVELQSGMVGERRNAFLNQPLCQLAGTLPVAHIYDAAPAYIGDELQEAGRDARLDYRDDGSVFAAVKLQELFGLADTPRVCDGRVPLVLGGNVLGSQRPVFNLTCVGDVGADPNNPIDPDAPPSPLDYGDWASDGLNNPTACAGTATLSGTPSYTIWNPDFEYPETFKASVGYEGFLGERTKVAVDLLYSRGTNMFTVRNLNLRPVQFTLDGEGERAVYTPEGSFGPGAANTLGSRIYSDMGDVFVNYNDGRSSATTAAFELKHALTDGLLLTGAYAYTRAFDNASIFCCTSISNYSDPMVGAFGPNDLVASLQTLKTLSRPILEEMGLRNREAALKMSWSDFAGLFSPDREGIPDVALETLEEVVSGSLVLRGRPPHEVQPGSERHELLRQARARRRHPPKLRPSSRLDARFPGPYTTESATTGVSETPVRLGESRRRGGRRAPCRRCTSRPRT